MISDKKQEYLNKIKEIPTVSFNKEQKKIAEKIIEACDEKDLNAVFGLITQRVKTGFVFDEAPEVNHNAVTLAVESPELNINVTGLEHIGNTLEHKLIIGDNYDALKNLCATYINKNGKGLIDVIYIDPPYNTEKSSEDGNDYKDEVKASKFIYRDKFTRDGWLNMMNERLKLARKLLSDKGVIFISIDDSEQAYLKVLCDEIFGEGNFQSCITHIVKPEGRMYGNIAKTHEYILCYAKHDEDLIFSEIEKQDKEFDFEDNFGGFNIKNLENGNAKAFNASNRPNLRYPFYVNLESTNNDDFMKVSVEPQKGWVEVFPSSKNELDYVWRWEKKRSEKELNNLVARKSEKDKIIIFQKNRKNTTRQKSIIWGKDTITKKGTDEYKKYEIKKTFSNPKPLNLLKRLLKISTSKIEEYPTYNNTPIILDFFAGSGTTGQAVMELNEEDGGNRHFILVTNNENNIAENITRERLYRVINGKGSKGESISWKYKDETPCLKNNAVRVFKTHTEELTLNDLEKAEKLKELAQKEFVKLNENYTASEIDIYNDLAALNPIKE